MGSLNRRVKAEPKEESGEREETVICWSSGEIMKRNSGEFYFLKVMEGSIDLRDWDINAICVLRVVSVTNTV